MGLLFTALIVGIGIVVFAILVFILSLFFQPLSWAMRASSWATVGAIVGMVIAGALSVLINDIDVKFVTSPKQFAYFFSLAMGSLLGGCFMLLLFIKNNRTNPSFKKAGR